jgi:protein-tyrosine-phosphatase
MKDHESTKLLQDLQSQMFNEEYAQKIEKLKIEENKQAKITKALLKEADKICPLTKENQQILHELSDSIDQLIDDIAECNNKKLQLAHLDPKIADEFDQAQKKYDFLRTDLSDQENQQHV